MKTNPRDNSVQHEVKPAEQIAQIAYRLFEERGGQHGHDVEDWLEAERQFAALPSDSADEVPAPRPPTPPKAKEPNIPVTAIDSRERIHRQSTPFRTPSRSVHSGR